MRWVQALTGFRGRLRRRDFWIGLILLLIVEIALSFLFVGIMRPTGATELELAALWLALAILVWGLGRADRQTAPRSRQVRSLVPAVRAGAGALLPARRRLLEQHLQRAQPGAAGLLAARGPPLDLGVGRARLHGGHAR